MLKIAFCLQSYVAQKLGHRECPRSTVVGRIRKKKLALFGFACLCRNAYGEDNQTFPKVGPVRTGKMQCLFKSQPGTHGGDDF